MLSHAFGFRFPPEEHRDKCGRYRPHRHAEEHRIAAANWNQTETPIVPQRHFGLRRPGRGQQVGRALDAARRRPQVPLQPFRVIIEAEPEQHDGRQRRPQPEELDAHPALHAIGALGGALPRSGVHCRTIVGSLAISSGDQAAEERKAHGQDSDQGRPIVSMDCRRAISAATC